MKVLMVNGSPHKKGCTHTALDEIAKTLTAEGIESEIFWLGTAPVSGCLACGRCNELEGCFMDDCVNEFAKKSALADGFIFGSPVHYAGAGGSITAFMDRLFYSSESEVFRLKPAAAVVSARRAGTTAALEQLHKYFTISEMPVISSQYWCMVHGHKPEQVMQDAEGLQIMRTLARNMAWFLKCREAGERAGIPLPKQEDRVVTNFIR